MQICTFSCEGFGIEKGKHQLQFESEKEAREVRGLFEELGLKCGGIHPAKDGAFSFESDNQVEQSVKVFEEYLKNELLALECVVKITNCSKALNACIKKLGDNIFLLVGAGSSQYSTKYRVYYILQVISSLKLVSIRTSFVVEEVLGKVLPRQIFLAFRS